MRKVFVAAMGIAAVLTAPAALAAKPIPIHFIYQKAGATVAAFQSDRDLCANRAQRPRYMPVGTNGGWMTREHPSSTVFLNCMKDKGYTLTNKDGWDTGVMWTLPLRS